MRLAIIGDGGFPESVYGKGKPVNDPAQSVLPEADGTQGDGLCYLGSIADCEMVSYQEAYAMAKFFFMRAEQEGIALIRRGNQIFKIDIAGGK
ncbi:MAG: hypothetical protein ACM34I_01055 [bacterium]